MPQPEEMTIIDVYNEYLSILRAANTIQERAEVANMFLNEVWRGGDTARKYAKFAADYSYPREQLEKAVDRICVTHDEDYSVRRSISAIYKVPQLAILADDEATLTAIIKMGAAVYMSRTKPGRFINYINSKLPAKLTYGQASLLLDTLFYGSESFPKTSKPNNTFNVLLALMIKCGREVRRTHKRAVREKANVTIIRHDENMLKAIISTILALYISFLIKLLLTFGSDAQAYSPHDRP